MGYEIEECDSECNALDKSKELDENSSTYPVYYSVSNTTGEKPNEEFFTDDETTDMQRYKSLGVVTSVKPRPIAEINELFNQLNLLFRKPNATKHEIVDVMKSFLKNFEHEEKGLNLDSKM